MYILQRCGVPRTTCPILPFLSFYKTVASTKSCTNRRSRFPSINNFITYT